MMNKKKVFKRELARNVSTAGCVYCRDGEKLPLAIHSGALHIEGGCIQVELLTAFMKRDGDGHPYHPDRVELSKFTDFTKIGISYCPMCGREL